MAKIYPGVSAFFANRTKPNDKHDWRQNHKRPVITLVHTNPTGKRSYVDLFQNDDKDFSFRVVKGRMHISFPADTNKPLARMLIRPQQQAEAE